MNSINAGVPQGSVLGPTLFLIYINDLLNSTVSELHSFADDTTMHVSSKFSSPPSANILLHNRVKVAAQINNDLDIISKWGAKWNIKFNPKKCDQLIISNKKSSVFPDLVFEGSILPASEDIRLLGITIDSGLTWSQHIASQSKKAAQMLGCLARARHLIPPHHMTTLYKAKIRPLLEYCSTVWGSACDTHLNLLDQVEKRAARIVGPTFKVPYNLSTRRVTGGLALIHKLLQGRGSEELQLLLPPFNIQSSYALRSNSNVHQFTFNIPFCRTESRKRSFRIQFSTLWNALPPTIANPGLSATRFKSWVSQKPP